MLQNDTQSEKDRNGYGLKSFLNKKETKPKCPPNAILSKSRGTTHDARPSSMQPKLSKETQAYKSFGDKSHQKQNVNADTLPM